MESIWYPSAATITYAAVSWVIAQAAPVLQFLFRQWRLRNALLHELSWAIDEVSRIRRALLGQISELAGGQIRPISVIDVRRPIAEAYFSEVLQTLSKEQWASYLLIGEHQKKFSVALQKFENHMHEWGRRDLVDAPNEEYETLFREQEKHLRSLFLSLHILDWYMRYHLEHQHLPDLEPNSPEERDFSESCEQANAAVDRILDARSQ